MVNAGYQWLKLSCYRWSQMYMIIYNTVNYMSRFMSIWITRLQSWPWLKGQMISMLASHGRSKNLRSALVTTSPLLLIRCIAKGLEGLWSTGAISASQNLATVDDQHRTSNKLWDQTTNLLAGHIWWPHHFFHWDFCAHQDYHLVKPNHLVPPNWLHHSL